jgi:predicted PurR-regulated permease PerM
MSPSELDPGRLGWWGVAAAVGLTLAFVVYSFVGTFVFALFIYYSTRPVYRRLRRRGVRPASLAALVSLLILALPAVVLLVYTIAIGLQELSGFAEIANLGPLADVVGPYVDISSVVDDPATLVQDPTNLDRAREAFGAALQSLGIIGKGLLHLFVMFALAFYLLRDGHRLGRLASRYGDDEGVLLTYFEAIDRDFSSIFFGNILNAVMTGAIGAISYSLLNVVAPPELAIPYPALLGLLTGIASLIPVVGMKIVYVPVAIYMGVLTAIAGGPWWFLVLFVAVSFVVVDAIPDFMLRPYVSGRNLHVGSVMFAYILGPLLFGWYGIFLGPIILVVVFHFVRVVLPELVEGTEIRPYTVDPTYLTDGDPDPETDPGPDVGDGAPAADGGGE